MILLFLLFSFVNCESDFYDAFTGQLLSSEELQQHIRTNTTSWCVAEVQPCDPYERRRVDGTCNNLDYPDKGAIHTPMLRLLPADFGTNFEPRKDKCGEPLPMARPVRTTLLAEGRVPDDEYTHLLTYIWEFTNGDVISLEDVFNYITTKPYCCAEQGKTDYACIPSRIPDDDPVHRFSNQRCTNLTRPISYQLLGCAKKDTQPERVVTATSVFDLSQIYGHTLEELNEKGREFEGGRLKTEIENDIVFPPSAPNVRCMLNEPPHETRCHDTPNIAANGLLGTTMVSVWVWRMHNRIANVLSDLNPCWDDDKVFWVAKDINLAYMMQMYYYEMYPALMGRKNLMDSGVISDCPGFRDVYNKNVMPQIYLEFPYILRWAHTLQESNVKHMETNGTVVKEVPIVDLSLRPGYLVDNIKYITHGSYRQATGKPDYVVDPDIAERGLGRGQAVTDIPMSDLRKGRYFGFPGYIKYKELCTGRSITSFDDLKCDIPPAQLQLLMEKYKNVEDIDLMAGTWSEKHIDGGRVPPTLFCIVSQQMLRTMQCDRHWYELEDRPEAFTLAQLMEIRNASIAGLLCAVGDSVTQIQEHAFRMPGPGNKMLDCSKIKKINLWAWKDDSCDSCDTESQYGCFKI